MKMRFRKIMAAILSTAMVAAAIPAAGILNVQAKSPQEHIDLSRQVAGEGMVLMENDGALPLARAKKYPPPIWKPLSKPIRYLLKHLR